MDASSKQVPYRCTCRGNKYPRTVDTSELCLVTGDHGCRATKKPCDTVACVVTQVMGAGMSAGPNLSWSLKLRD